MSRPEVFTAQIGGLRVKFIAPGPAPEDAPAAVREGIIRRRIMYATGQCPCGATLSLRLPNRAERRRLQQLGQVPVVHVVIDHSEGCPAIEEHLHSAVRRWRAEQGRGGA
ncbi:hypothetical protein GCM10022403_087310 [Streptomyces coacervatus]|uniref:Uncharacterized protein n=1 Tax=Streptomyces coacervatus TaxID=647381 RepID=A0ABP7JE91_9ACTN